MKPFIKWAGGKRWLANHPSFTLPDYAGRYIEPFLGGGAVFFHLAPCDSLLSDLNPRLIQMYEAIRDDWARVEKELFALQKKHSKEFYYQERARKRRSEYGKAAQFIYLNRTCWNGLYRENLNGEFNVPIGTKTKVIFEDDSFEVASRLLANSEILCCDFERSIDASKKDDLIFADPPYTTAHNHNGFVKYNQKIFSWDDQVRLRDALVRAASRGVKVVLTNANHDSVHRLYEGHGELASVTRPSIISGKSSSRGTTSEAIYVL